MFLQALPKINPPAGIVTFLWLSPAVQAGVAQLYFESPPITPPSSSCFQMLSFEAMMPHLSYVSKERPCSALLNYGILLVPAPVGQEEEQVGGSQDDQST